MSTVLPHSASDIAAAILPSAMTAGDFAQSSHQKDFELVAGRLVERAMGVESDWIGSRLLTLLTNFVESHSLGLVFGPQAGYQLKSETGGDTVRKPDVSFVRFGRFPNDEPPKGWALLAPDLAAEVVSPGDLAEDLRAKLRQYQANGVRLVWILWPDAKSIDVYRLDGTTATLGGDDFLSGEDVLPEFRQRVTDIFTRPRPVPRSE